MILLALHIPDGFLSVPVAALGWLLALPAVAWALFGSRSLEDRFVPVAGLLAAFVFAAQTLQFPIPGGTSGHLVGASLVTILLGSPMGMVVLTAVLLLEAVVFGTGGLLALGWNTINMVVVMGLIGSGVYHALRGRGAGVWAAAFWSGWIATEFGSLVTCLELAAAQTTSLEVSLAAMMLTQAFVGVGEGLVTASAVAFLGRARPDLVPQDSPAAIRAGLVVLALVTVSTLLPPSIFGVAETTVAWGQYPALAVTLVLLAVTVIVWTLAGFGRRTGGP